MPTRTPEEARSRLVALIVGSAFFLVLLDSSIIATSLPRMALTFGVSALDLSLGISVYILSVAIFVPVSGWMSDRFGARRVFLLAIVVFTLASVACGAANSLLEFVMARALQGLGGAFMTPVGRVLVLGNARKSELIQVTALITWPALIAPVIGPVVGGFITTYFSWRWNFFINLPLGVIAFALAYRLIPPPAPAAWRPFDWKGFLLTAGALLCLLYGLESFAHRTMSAAQSGALVLTGALLAFCAIRYLRSVTHPLLGLSPFRTQTFALATLWAGTYIRVGINATPFLLPLLFQVGFGLSPFEAGGYVLIYFLGNLGMKTVTTALLRGFGFRSVLIINGTLCGLTIIAMGFITEDLAKTVVVLVLFAAGLTRSMQYTALNTLAFADIQAPERSSASTLTSMLQQVSMMLGIALGTLILSTSQLLSARDALIPADFRAAFGCMGLIVMAASLVFLKLPHNAGTEVTGHDSRTPMRRRLGLGKRQ